MWPCDCNTTTAVTLEEAPHENPVIHAALSAIRHSSRTANDLRSVAAAADVLRDVANDGDTASAADWESFYRTQVAEVYSEEYIRRNTRRLLNDVEGFLDGAGITPHNLWGRLTIQREILSQGR